MGAVGGDVAARDGGGDAAGFLALPDSGADFHVGARSVIKVPTYFASLGSYSGLALEFEEPGNLPGLGQHV